MQPIYDIPFQNQSGETIPAFAIMKCPVEDTASVVHALTSIEGQLVLQMVKPDHLFERTYYLNGPTPVPDQGFGMCTTADRGALVRMAPDAEGVWGENIGPRPGSWGGYGGGLGFIHMPSMSYWNYGAGEDEVTMVAVQRDRMSQVIGRLDSVMYAGGSFTLNLIGPTVGDVKMQIHGQDVGLLASAAMLDADRLIWAFRAVNGWAFGGCYPVATS